MIDRIFKRIREKKKTSQFFTIGDVPSVQACRRAWDAYVISPTKEAKEALRKAYYEVPEDMRCGLLHDMDRKDRPIKQVINSTGIIVLGDYELLNPEAYRY